MSKLHAWIITNDCKKCNKPHSVCIEEEERPEDDSVYAYECPNTHEEVKFRWKEQSWKFDVPLPKDSIKAYKSKA